MNTNRSAARQSAETRCGLEYKAWNKRPETSIHYDLAVARLMRIVREEDAREVAENTDREESTYREVAARQRANDESGWIADDDH